MVGILLFAWFSGSSLAIGLTLAGTAERSVLFYTSGALALYWLVVGALFVRTRVAHAHRKNESSTPPRRG